MFHILVQYSGYLIINRQSVTIFTICASSKDIQHWIPVVYVPIFSSILSFYPAGCMQEKTGNWKQLNRESLQNQKFMRSRNRKNGNMMSCRKRAMPKALYWILNSTCVWKKWNVRRTYVSALTRYQSILIFHFKLKPNGSTKNDEWQVTLNEKSFEQNILNKVVRMKYICVIETRN